MLGLTDLSKRLRLDYDSSVKLGVPLEELRSQGLRVRAFVHMFFRHFFLFYDYYPNKKMGRRLLLSMFANMIKDGNLVS